MSRDGLPENWRSSSFPALWEWLNDPRQNSTPPVTIEAILYCVRVRGLPALREWANIARLKDCDRAARDEINQRIEMMLEKGIMPHEPV